MDATLSDKICVVLVEPQFPGNIGMVCRAMKNMGLSSLRLVAGCNHLDDEAIKFAVSARDLLEKAERFDTLAEAVADCSISIGTTRRGGKYRQELLLPPQAAKILLSSATRSALVFGREDHGLSTEDLSLCSHQATIPASCQLGSLNLAQAALIFCYELFKAAEQSEHEPQRVVASSAELEPMFSQMEATLLKIGFLNQQNPNHIMRTFRRILFRAEMDSREVTVMRGMLSQIDWATTGFKSRKGG